MCRHCFATLLGIAGILVAAEPAFSDQPPKSKPPRIFLSNPNHLAKIRDRIVAIEESSGSLDGKVIRAAAIDARLLLPAISELRDLADKSRKSGPFSVVTNNKPRLAPSGDKHDYVSMAPYFWPDPTKNDGLPYIRKDGQVNPEREKFDAPPMGKMARAVHSLALAYYLVGDPQLAEHATKLLRVWFLDADTRMNPNLNYGQFIPGITDGRGIGIIDTVQLIKVVEGVGLLEGSPAWKPADQAGMEAWFRDYLQWMRTSKNGKEEAAALNNHGSWYDAQVAAYALFVGDMDTAKKVIEESKTKRIARQIERDGRQPLELKRTKGFDYSRVNLDALFALATMGDKLGVDLWNFETPDGRSMRKALDWLIPFAAGEKKWEHEQIKGVQGGTLAPFLRRAAVRYQEPRYEQLIEKLPGKGLSGVAALLYPE
jgi:Alginate lyase